MHANAYQPPTGMELAHMQWKETHSHYRSIKSQKSSSSRPTAGSLWKSPPFLFGCARPARREESRSLARPAHGADRTKQIKGGAPERASWILKRVANLRKAAGKWNARCLLACVSLPPLQGVKFCVARRRHAKRPEIPSRHARTRAHPLSLHVFALLKVPLSHAHIHQFWCACNVFEGGNCRGVYYISRALSSNLLYLPFASVRWLSLGSQATGERARRTHVG